MVKVNSAVVITGACGGIGRALVEAFNKEGYCVIATDLTTPTANLCCEHFIEADLEKLVNDDGYAKKYYEQIFSILKINT